MKKILSLFLIGALCFTLVGCGNKDNDDNNNYNNNDNSNTNNGDINNNPQYNDLEERLKSDIFSIKYPEGWEKSNNQGDPEAKDPNSEAFIQLTVVGLLADTFCEVTRRGVPVAEKIGNYTFQNCGGVYIYEHGSYTGAVMSFYLVDDDIIKEVLSTFKLHQ